MLVSQYQAHFRYHSFLLILDNFNLQEAQFLILLIQMRLLRQVICLIICYFQMMIKLKL